MIIIPYTYNDYVLSKPLSKFAHALLWLLTVLFRNT